MYSEVIDSIEKQLESLEYRQAFGSETIKYDLASALVKARNQAELSQEKLANLLNVSQAYIAKLESGNANPTIGRIGALLAIMYLRLQFKLQSLTHTIEERQSAVPEVRPKWAASTYNMLGQSHSGTADGINFSVSAEGKELYGRANELVGAVR